MVGRDASEPKALTLAVLVVCEMIVVGRLTMVLVEVDAHHCRHAHALMNECRLGIEVHDGAQVERDAHQSTERGTMRSC